jgi:hypothetical protein
MKEKEIEGNTTRLTSFPLLSSSSYSKKFIGYFTYQMLNGVWGVCSMLLKTGLYGSAASECGLILSSITREAASKNVSFHWFFYSNFFSFLIGSFLLLSL